MLTNQPCDSPWDHHGTMVRTLTLSEMLLTRQTRPGENVPVPFKNCYGNFNGNITTKYGLICYSTSILGSWNDHWKHVSSLLWLTLKAWKVIVTVIDCLPYNLDLQLRVILCGKAVAHLTKFDTWWPVAEHEDRSAMPRDLRGARRHCLDHLWMIFQLL